MVELSDPKGPVKEGIDNSIFLLPSLIIIPLVCFFVYRLILSLREKQKVKEEKKKIKQQRKDKELARKQKKR